MSKFSERLKELRVNHNLSQQELASQLGCVSKSSINMYERGEREPSIDTLEAIADYFNVDMDYLLGKSSVQSRYSAIIDQIQRYERKYRPKKNFFILNHDIPVDPEFNDYNNLDDSASDSITFYLYDSNGTDYEFDIHCVGNEIEKMWALLKSASKVPIEHLDMARIMLDSIPKTYKDSE